METVSITMLLKRKCKNSVVFEATTDEPAVKTLYLMNGGYELLGMPQKIEVEISIEKGAS